MPNGISTNRWCHPSASCLAAAGIAFVVRYYSRTTTMREKLLRPDEARQIAAAGIDLAVVYQDRGRQEVDFGGPRGELDANTALQQAAAVGQPPGSAIYFAVDTDFGRAQITRVVLPYFQAVRRISSQAGGRYKIGVYGSGLTCRLLKEAPGLVDYAWLAEATGWRESRTYAAWDMKQFVNHANLCALGPDWQRCEARADFGQFRPIGSVRARARMAGRVVGTSLPLPLLAMPDAGAPAAFPPLPYGTPVEVLGEAGHGWLRVSVALDEGAVIGYVEADGLARRTRAHERLDALSLPQVPEVHLARDNRNSSRANAGMHAYPLGEPRLPLRDPAASGPAKAAALTRLADWMDVERSARYRPTALTYCNIYAADYCFLAQVYLPRVWWNAKALAAFARGERPAPIYGRTLMEMRADHLHAWLLDFGAQFGWRRTADLDVLQAAVNAGGVAVICADREAEGRPGHITVVVPEVAGHAAVREADGTVRQPLQTQAGSRNHRYDSSGPDWWLGEQFRSFVMFLHD